MHEPSEIQALSQRILVQAAQRAGGLGALSKHLGVDDATLGDWIAGKRVPPAQTILKAVSLLVDGRGPAGAPPAASLQGQQDDATRSG